jgi:hypothetical protein
MHGEYWTDFDPVSPSFEMGPFDIGEWIKLRQTIMARASRTGG